MIFKVWSNLFLFLCAVVDFKTKKVYPSICLINYVLAVGVKFLLNDFDAGSLFLGGVLCIGMLMISLITKGAIGQGDVLILLTLTGILDVEKVIKIILIAFLICSVFSVIMLLTKKMKGKDEIPFVPFLLIGQWICLMLGE